MIKKYILKLIIPFLSFLFELQHKKYYNFNYFYYVCCLVIKRRVQGKLGDHVMPIHSFNTRPSPVVPNLGF